MLCCTVQQKHGCSRYSTTACMVTLPPCWLSTSTVDQWPIMLLRRRPTLLRSNPALSTYTNVCTVSLASSSITLCKTKFNMSDLTADSFTHHPKKQLTVHSWETHRREVLKGGTILYIVQWCSWKSNLIVCSSPCQLPPLVLCTCFTNLITALKQLTKL